MVRTFTFGWMLPDIGTFTFVDGMTWGEFIASDYNPLMSTVYPGYTGDDRKFFVDAGGVGAPVYDVDGEEWFDSQVVGRHWDDIGKDFVEDEGVQLLNNTIKPTYYKTQD